MSRHVIEQPETIKVEEIEREWNMEVRRVMIERYGLERFIVDSGAEAIHQDEFGVLYCKELSGDESLLMVEVINSTPNPDGSFKHYFIQVPPEIETARSAVAWSFGFNNPKEYLPTIET